MVALAFPGRLSVAQQLGRRQRLCILQQRHAVQSQFPNHYAPKVMGWPANAKTLSDLRPR